MHNMLCLFFLTLVNCVWETEPKGWSFSFYCCFQLLFSKMPRSWKSQESSLLSIFNKTSSSSWFSLGVITNRYYNQLPPTLTKLCSFYAFDLPQLPLFSSHCHLRHSYFFNFFLLTQEICMPKGTIFDPKIATSLPFPWDSLRALHELETANKQDEGQDFKLAAEVLRGEKLVMITSLMESQMNSSC